MSIQKRKIEKLWDVLCGHDWRILFTVPKSVVVANQDWELEIAQTLKRTKWSRFFSILFHSDFTLANSVYSLKNSIYLEDNRATGSSNSLTNHYPPLSSTIYKHLSKDKAIHLITTSLDEFGMGDAGVFCDEGVITNPSSPKRVIGGSSSGSAYLIARNLVDFAIVTDTGGSSRIPAAYNSFYGFKPSFGLVSREGILPLCTLFDTPAILANSLTVISKVLSTISSADPSDLTTLKTKKVKYFPLKRKLLGLKRKCLFSRKEKKKKVRFIVINETYQIKNKFLNQRELKIRESFRKLVDRLKFHLDFEVVNTSLKWPELDLCEIVYRIVAYSEIVTHYLSLNNIVTPWERDSERDKDTRLKKIEVGQHYMKQSEKIRAQMGSEAKIRHLLGYFFLYGENYSNIYLKARKVITLWKEYFSNLLLDGGVIISPTTEDIAPLLSEYSNDYKKDNFYSLVLFANFCGLPAISIPWSSFKSKLDSSKVYMGLHLISRYREDKYLLAIVNYLQKSNIL